MLNPFPELLAYSFFVPMLFRLTVAGVFVYLLFFHFTHRREVVEDIQKIARPIAGVGLYIILALEVITAAGLFLGAWTQIFAILGFLGFIKMALFKNKFPAYAPLSKGTYAILAVICLSLFITGAGAFAFDLPL